MQNLIPNERLNITHLKEMVKNSDKVVLGWGNAGKNPKWLKQIISYPYCFGTNQNGSPKHPLYLSYNTTLNPYEYSLH